MFFLKEKIQIFWFLNFVTFKLLVHLKTLIYVCYASFI